MPLILVQSFNCFCSIALIWRITTPIGRGVPVSRIPLNIYKINPNPFKFLANIPVSLKPFQGLTGSNILTFITGETVQQHYLGC